MHMYVYYKWPSSLRVCTYVKEICCECTRTDGDDTYDDGGHREVWSFTRALPHNDLHLVMGDTQDAAVVEWGRPPHVIQRKRDDLLHSFADHLHRGGGHDDREHDDGDGLQLGATCTHTVLQHKAATYIDSCYG